MNLWYENSQVQWQVQSQQTLMNKRCDEIFIINENSQKLLASEGGRSTLFAWSRRRPGRGCGKCWLWWLCVMWTWKSVKNKAIAGCRWSVPIGQMGPRIWKCSFEDLESCLWNLKIHGPSVELWTLCRPKALVSTWCHHRRLNAVFCC